MRTGEQTTACVVPGCDAPVVGRGWCSRHYKRWRRHGDPEIVRPRENPAALFWAKVDVHGPVPQGAPELGPCWRWTGATRNGCGAFHTSTGGGATRPIPAHQWSYTHHHGPVPAGLAVGHLCHLADALTVGCGAGPTCPHRSCVNPAHLVLVAATPRPAGGAPRHPAQTRCPRGHAYDLVDARGRRRCTRCAREHAATLLAAVLDNDRPRDDGRPRDDRQRPTIERLTALAEYLPSPSPRTHPARAAHHPDTPKDPAT
jgi:hypothetical protein